MAAQRKPSEWQDAPAGNPVILAETLRLAHPPLEPENKGEEKLSLFWRIFGGTLMSIAAMAAVTVYQQTSSSLSELRAGQTRLQESNGDLAKKDDLKQETAALWGAVKEGGGAPAMAARTAELENKVRTLEQERKDFCIRLVNLSERLANLEGRTSIRPVRPVAPPKIELTPED